MASVVGLAYLPIRALPDRLAMPAATVMLHVRPVQLAPVGGSLRLAGAWELHAPDPRFGGISALALDGRTFLAVSDRGSVLRFDPPTQSQPTVQLADLRAGPGAYGKKWARDAESLARDPIGRGWWVGYEQRHSLWLYDRQFDDALAAVDLGRSNWRDNRGAEGLVVRNGGLLALGENGRDVIRIEGGKVRPLKLHSPADIAEAARAPDGGTWVLLREKGWGGISQSVAQLAETHDGFRVGPAWPVPRGAFDNFEGMAIAARDDGGWRFWLISDDGHRFFARTLLVALDLDLPVRHDKSPALSTGLSKKRRKAGP